MLYTKLTLTVGLPFGCSSQGAFLVDRGDVAGRVPEKVTYTIFHGPLSVRFLWQYHGIGFSTFFGHAAFFADKPCIIRENIKTREREVWGRALRVQELVVSRSAWPMVCENSCRCRWRGGRGRAECGCPLSV